MPSQLFDSFRSFYRALAAYHWWQIAIELLLIGLVVYWVVRFLRGTRGARMLRGIAFLLIAGYLIVSLLASQFGLDRVRFLYERFLLFAGFAITVAFQPELRRALMRLREATIFPGRPERRASFGGTARSTKRSRRWSSRPASSRVARSARWSRSNATWAWAVSP